MATENNKRDVVEMVKNQEGSILLFAMMIMVLVTLIGFSALNSTNTELTISQNDRCYKQNVYRAEAAVLEAGQLMEDETDSETNLKPATSPSSWLVDGSDSDNPPDFNPLTSTWEYGEANQNSQRSALYNDNLSGYTVVFEGIAPGASYDMSLPSHLWQYAVYGRSEQCGGRVDIVTGYRKRY